MKYTIEVLGDLKEQKEAKTEIIYPCPNRFLSWVATERRLMVFDFLIG